MDLRTAGGIWLGLMAGASMLHGIWVIVRWARSRPGTLGESRPELRSLLSRREMRTGTGEILAGVAVMLWVYLGLVVMGTGRPFQSPWEWAIFLLSWLLLTLGAILHDDKGNR